jgi:DNA-binding response OmpR family regulator
VKRVLIVDDDENLIESAKDILEDSGYAVQTSGTLAAARAALAGGSVDIVMVDFNLPDGKGPDLARTAKAAKPDLCILLMTGEAAASVGNDAALFNAVLTKPVDPAALLSLLATLDANDTPPA